MRITVKLHIDSEETSHCVETTVAQFHRNELSAASLGLHLVEAKQLLEGVQRNLVEAQVNEYIALASHCARCRTALTRKGHHHLVYRTPLGRLLLVSPRLYRCARCETPRSSFSPLAEILTARTSPELQYLEGKFVGLVSYGATIDLLSEVLPIAESVKLTSLKRGARQLGERLDDQPEERPASSAFPADSPIPDPSPVMAVGIDGGYVRAHDAQSRQAGWFEVMVGKSLRYEGGGKCFAYVHRQEPNPSNRMRQFLSEQGVKPDHPVTFLSDGGDTVRQAQAGFAHLGEYVLDWFHVAMRFTGLSQLAKGLAVDSKDDEEAKATLLKDLDSAKWHLWHGCPYRSLQKLEDLSWQVEVFAHNDTRDKFAAKLAELDRYIEVNEFAIINYGDRFRHGEPIATGFAESAVNQVLSKRFVKKQQMRWSMTGAHALLQIRTRVLNDELRTRFEQWYPDLAANDDVEKLAA